jgi:hypothetical protein
MGEQLFDVLLNQCVHDHFNEPRSWLYTASFTRSHSVLLGIDVRFAGGHPHHR